MRDEEMEASYLLKGLLIGLSIAAPVGPIGLLCIRRTLAGGLSAGIVSGAGAATADALYGWIAGMGLTFVSSFLTSEQNWLRMVGGAFLLYLGVRTFVTTAEGMEGTSAAARGKGLLPAFASTFFLTVTNPLTILSFAAIFAGLGLANGGPDYFSASLLVCGVFVGSILWWCALCGSMNLLRGKFSPGAMAWVNRVSGAAITAFGLAALLKLA
jgi:threonine/homoserine/homoserine lactone efflux protein